MYIVIGFEGGEVCLMSRKIFTDYKSAKDYADSCNPSWFVTVFKQVKE